MVGFWGIDWGYFMKKFIVYLLVIILTVSLGFAIFYLVRDNEVISISSASIYKDAGDTFTLDIDHTNKKSYTEITVTSSDEDIVDGHYDSKNGQYKATAKTGGVARINVRTTNTKFRNLWCDVIVGDGTIESPYYISTAEQLSAIGMGAEITDENGVATGVYAGATGYEQYHSDLCYKLVSNIDASTVNNGYWVPLQNFNGRFDGNGHTISNIYIDVDGYQEFFGDNADIRFMSGKNAGMFASVGADSVVYNFKLENYMAVGTYGEFGTIAAVNRGTIERIEVKDAYLSVKSAVFGGLVARNETTESLVVKTDDEGRETATYERNIARLDRNSIHMTLGQKTTVDANGNSTVSVLGVTGTVGGIVGINNGGTIVYCYTRGEVYFGDDSSINTIYGGVVAKNTALTGLHYNDKNSDESEYQGANIRDCYADLSTTLLATPVANSVFGGAIGINQDYKNGEFETDEGTIDHVVNNYLIGIYYNKDSLNEAQDGITKNFEGIAKFMLNSDAVDFSDTETVVYGLTAEEMTDQNNFVSHRTQELVFNSEGTSKGIVEKQVLWLFETVWAIDAETNDGMPYLNYQLIYIPDDFDDVGTPIVARTLNNYYFDIEIDYPISILSGTDGKVRVRVEEYYQLEYTPTGIDLTWKSSDESVVTVDENGKLYGAKVGVATVTVTTKRGSEATITVIVENIAYHISAPSIISLYQTQTFNLNDITITPTPVKHTPYYSVLDTTGQSTSDVAYISNGKLVASDSKTGTAVLVIEVADTKVEVTVVVSELPEVKLYADPTTVAGHIDSMTTTGVISITSSVSENLRYTYQFVSGSGIVDLSWDSNNSSKLRYTVRSVGSAIVRVEIAEGSYTGKGSVDIYFNIKGDENVNLTASPSSVVGYYSTMPRKGYITISNSAGINLSYTAQTSNSDVVTMSMVGNTISYTINGVGYAYITISVTTNNYKGATFVTFSVMDDPDTPVVPNIPSTPSTPDENIVISNSSITIYKGDSYTLSTSGNYSGLTWTTSNSSIATVDSNGKVTGVGVGTAEITVSSQYAVARCVVYVKEKPATVTYSISLQPTSLSLNVGESYTLKASGVFDSIGWTSSKTNIVSVDKNGVIKAVGDIGTSIVTATAIDSSGRSVGYAYCTVTVSTPVSITLSRSNTNINVGDSVTIRANVFNSTNIVTWTYGGPATFTVDGNTLTAKATAVGEITATAKLGSASANTRVVVNESTAYSPYIYNLTQLNNVRYNLDKDYYLAANINVGNWTPIENFTGSLSNVGTYVISNITVSGATNAGLFGSVSGASFKGIIVSGSNISGATYAGAIAAKASNTKFDSCNVQSSTVTASKYVGGIVGYAYSNSVVNNCNVISVTSTATGSTAYVGGAVGYTNGSSVTNSNINGGSAKLGSNGHGYAGGVIGYMASSKVASCLVYGNISISANSSDSDFAGGICGYTNGYTSATISSSTVRNATVSGYYAGGIGGSLLDTRTVTLHFDEYKSGYRYEDLTSQSFSVAVQTTAVRETVTVKGTMIGGLFGVIKAGVVSNCYTRAVINGTSSSAVKAGFASTINASSSFSNTGGSGTCGLVINCYSACTFSGSGKAYSITSSLVHNYASVGSGTSRAGYCMNYLFDNDKDGSATYYDGSNIFSSDKVKAKKSSSEMQTSSTYTNKGFSTSFWNLSGYPTLRNEK